MGHRALLAYRRDDSTDESDLAEEIGLADETITTCDEPNPTDEPDPTQEATYDLHRSHWGGADFALLGRLSAEDPFAAETSFAVDPEPIATDLSMAEIVADHLNFLHHEAFYRVGSDYRTTAFHVCWFGLEADTEAVERSETVGHGALVEVLPESADYFRGWFRGTKTTVGDMINRDYLSPDAATDYLAERATEWGDNREVLLPD